MRAGEYDYIIKGINGELYPCKADIFEKTYEAADDVASMVSKEMAQLARVDHIEMIKPIAIIVGSAVIWVASCLLLRKDKRKRVAFRDKG